MPSAGWRWSWSGPSWPDLAWFSGCRCWLTGSSGGCGLALDGVLWLAVAITTGTDVWTIAGTAGKAVASSLVTPQAIGGTGGLLAWGLWRSWG